jgi:hypothetical protein
MIFDGEKTDFLVKVRLQAKNEEKCRYNKTHMSEVEPVLNHNSKKSSEKRVFLGVKGGINSL